MGIDVYVRWRGQTHEEGKAQVTGFSIVSGHVGYLREAYHGEPYATKVMFPECWDHDLVAKEGVRLPLTQEDIERFESYAGFSVYSGAVQLLPKMRDWFGEWANPRYDSEADEFTVNSGAISIPAATLRERLPLALNANTKRYEGSDLLPEIQNSYVKFVELYERLEAEGKEPAVYVSY
jgi:hypothetical protein